MTNRTLGTHKSRSCNPGWRPRINYNEKGKNSAEKIVTFGFATKAGYALYNWTSFFEGIKIVASRRVGAVDMHVGRRVRAARLAHRISQEKLAEAVGVSFQQIQKYEKGVNRIGTGRLHAIAKLLQLPVTYFFDGIDKNPSKASRDSMNAITEALSTAEGVRIAVALSRIHDAEMRRRVAKLLEALIETESKGIRSLSKV